MAVKKMSRAELLAKFFDDGAYTQLFADGAVSAAFGCVNGETVYAVCQNGEAVSVKDTEKNIKVLEMAAETGNPVVTFYDSVGAKLPEGAEVLAVGAKAMEAISKVSGVVPQIAVITGVCGGSSALAAASADLCILSEEADFFFTPPFTSAANGDKTDKAAAAQSVAAFTAPNAEKAVELAALIVGMLPANNLASPALFQFAEPDMLLNLTSYKAVTAVEALADKGSVQELFKDYGKGVCTALATIKGSTVGILATDAAKQLCHKGTAKAAHFVRFCDAFSIPVVSIVNAEGFGKSTAEDADDGIRSAARLASTMADATTVKVAVLAGKVIGPMYTAFAAADVRIAVQGCTVGAVEPQVAVSVLYKDEIDASDNIIAATNAAAAKYAAENCSADAAVIKGLADMATDAAGVRGMVIAALDMMSTKRAQRMAKKHGNMAL